MSGVAPISKLGWEPWPRDLGVGFSFSSGNVRGDMQPAKGEDGLIGCRAVFWLGDRKHEPVLEVFEEDHWRCARASLEMLSSEGLIKRT